jgi:hypothetical protein
LKGLKRFLICWVAAALIEATFFQWRAGGLSFVVALFDPVLALLAAVVAFVWSKVAASKAKTDLPAQS